MQRTTVKPVLVVTAGALLQMILQLAMQILIARHFGLTSKVDAYEVAIALPLVIAAILGLPIGSVLIPVVNRAQRDGGEPAAWGAASRIGSVMLLATLTIAGLLALTAKWIVAVLYSGLGSEMPQAVALIHILAWLIPANVMTAFCQAVHNWQGRFAISALAGVVGPGATLLTVLVKRQSLTIDDIAYAALIGAIVNVFVQAPGLLRYLSWAPRFNLRSPIFFMFLPLLLGGLYLRIDPVVDRSLGSNFEEGTAACIGNSNRVINAAVAVAVGGLSVVAFPRMAKAAQQGSGELSHELADAVRALVTILVPLSAALWFFGGDLIRDLFERGRFTPADTLRVALFVKCSLGVLVGGCLGEITSRAFYANHDMKTPTVIGIACFTVAFALKFALSRTFGAGGILAASSLGVCASAGIQMAVLRTRIGVGVLDGLIARLLLASAATVAACLAGAAVLRLALRLPSVWGGLAGLAVYAAVLTITLKRGQRQTATLAEREQPTAEELTEEQTGLNRP
jgi:putative peptidoglycan lipid II flippase